jgi:hypothetical protein
MLRGNVTFLDKTVELSAISVLSPPSTKKKAAKKDDTTDDDSSGCSFQ